MNAIAARIHNPDLGLLLIRSMVGVVGVYHGAQKLFGAWDGMGLSGFAGFLESLGVPLPWLSAVLAGSAEFFGGLLLILGVFPRLVAVPFLITMAVAIATVHPNAFNAAENGMEYPLTIAVVLLGIVFAGGGRYGLGRLIAARVSERHALVPAGR